METLSVSEFKSTCLAVLKRVKRTGRPILVTRFGVPMAEVVPATSSEPATEWLGCMQGRASIRGDVVAPALRPRAWRALHK
jgi:prevent-host-death family protein